MIYTVRYTEELEYLFEIEADSKEEALMNFDRSCNNGEIVFDDATILTTNVEIM